ncbi:MAG: type II toxin-antitoxin system prevent-host-death family antitoxin [Acidobacteria bacterium]|nr:type II toxin-antitoxin system prevent-host-death family antitoxin [Acidobacteriota bacterium]
MKSMAISEFKAHALKVLDEVAKSRETVIITKRGIPIAEVGPHRGTNTKAVPGKLEHVFVFEKDIVSPLEEEEWEACR